MRIRLWKVYVVSSVLHALTAAGVTRGGMSRLRVMFVKHLRRIAGSYRHISQEADATLLHRLGLDTPQEMYTSRLRAVLQHNDDLTEVLQANDIRLDPAQTAWEKSLLQALDPQEAASATPAADLTCPDCGKLFYSQASLRQHRASAHRRGLTTRGQQFDILQHALDGMPQCRACGHRFRRMPELALHITAGRCQVLFPVQIEVGLSTHPEPAGRMHQGGHHEDQARTPPHPVWCQHDGTATPCDRWGARSGRNGAGSRHVLPEHPRASEAPCQRYIRACISPAVAS